jgi:hypothetical protein
MSFAERRQWEDELRFAGWEQDRHGAWFHEHVAGLHNLHSAIAHLLRWIV